MASIEKRNIHIAARCRIDRADLLLTGEGDYCISSPSSEGVAVQVMILRAGVLKIASTKILLALQDGFLQIPFRFIEGVIG